MATAGEAWEGALMTKLSELIDIPEAVHPSDFVISLTTAISDPAATLHDYVVTPQLAECFDQALSLVASAAGDRRSKATYLHASFGAGKTAMMAVLHLLLQGDPSARAIPELAPVIAKYAPRLDGKRYLMVPYHFIGKSSMEQAVLGGYVEHLERIEPNAPLPGVYVSDGVLDDAKQKRADLGDDIFFRVLSEGEVADEWGEYGAGWDAERFEAAIASPPGTSEHEQLVSALLRTHYRALPGQAQATAEGFVPLDAGLNAISRHAHDLGYDAVIFFLDELVLWLESRMSEVAFVSREGNKIVQLVEADATQRPAPIVSFVARQRDLRELVGDNVLGTDAVSAMDVLRHSEGRFGTIRLEDRNLPAIAEKRLLQPRTEQARQQIDDAFVRLRRDLEERQESDVLLTETGDLAAFRRLYPFSPALVDALVALSGAMQRERTALKVMLQLLVDGRETLELGQLVPLGDLWDVIDAGDEPLTEVMRAQFAQARRLWRTRFQPVLLRDHDLTEDSARHVPRTHAYVTDARLVKSLLIGALVPEVGPLRALTVSRLTALNAGVVRAFVPGTERQQVLEKLRRWQAEIGELKVGDDEQDPTVSVELTGIDLGPIFDMARRVDSDGDRRRRVRELLTEVLQVKDAASFDAWIEVTWRGTRRRVDLLFGNVRDTVELPDEMLRAGTSPKLVIDFPWDAEDYSPNDDRGRVTDFRNERPPERTAVWLPNFLTSAARQTLGRLVQLDYVLSGDTFESFAGYLAPADRPTARTQLVNQRDAVRERVLAALRQAYGVDPPQPEVVEVHLAPRDQLIALDASLTLQSPPGTSLRTHADGVAAQVLQHQFPKHPEFTELVSAADLRHTYDHVVRALQQPNGRLENVEPPMRRVLTRVAQPLQLGTMYAAHFVADVSVWTDLFERARAEAATATVTVGEARRWLDGIGTAERRGLTPEVGELLVLVVAAATNRVVVASGQPVPQPQIGRLRDEWQLRAQELPGAETWERALQRSNDIGIVPASALLSANSVADLGQRIHGFVAENEQAARDLVPRLEAAYARLGVTDGERLRTARAAVVLGEELRRRPDHGPEVLASCDAPTTVAALGTSVAQSAPVGDELNRMNWDLVRAVAGLPEPFTGDAAALQARLVEALEADELVVPLVARLRDATHAATDLLARATKRSPGVQAPSPGADGYNRAAAEAELQAIRDRLRVEAHLDLTWTITELG